MPHEVRATCKERNEDREHSHDCETPSDNSLTSEVPLYDWERLVSVKRINNHQGFSWDSDEVRADDKPNDSRPLLSAVA